MTGVDEWTGTEARILRLARRMSVREFAAHLGVSDRIVSKWEAAGRATRPREVNQAALDESLRRSSDEERRRFEDALQGLPDEHHSRGKVRWCLIIDLPPTEVGLAATITAAVNAVLHAERNPNPATD